MMHSRSFGTNSGTGQSMSTVLHCLDQCICLNIIWCSAIARLASLVYLKASNFFGTLCLAPSFFPLSMFQGSRNRGKIRLD